MKKAFLCCVLLLLWKTTAYSQEVEISLKGGMNVATLGRSELGLPSRIGYHLGGTAEFITTPFFSIQTELMYSLQGAAIDRSQQIYLNYHYLNIPILAKAYFYEDASFEIGGQYAYLLKAVNQTYLGNQSDEINKHDFSVVFGLAYKLNETINAGIRYNLGITNTADRDIIYEQRYTNRVLQIYIGYIFR